MGQIVPSCRRALRLSWIPLHLSFFFSFSFFSFFSFSFTTSTKGLPLERCFPAPFSTSNSNIRENPNESHIENKRIAVFRLRTEKEGLTLGTLGRGAWSQAQSLNKKKCPSLHLHPLLQMLITKTTSTM